MSLFRPEIFQSMARFLGGFKDIRSLIRQSLRIRLKSHVRYRANKNISRVPWLGCGPVHQPCIASLKDRWLLTQVRQAGESVNCTVQWPSAFLDSAASPIMHMLVILNGIITSHHYRLWKVGGQVIIAWSAMTSVWCVVISHALWTPKGPCWLSQCEMITLEFAVCCTFSKPNPTLTFCLI